MKVAVYGTLRQGFGNNRLLADSKYLGLETLKGPFSMISCGGFPAIFLHENKEISNPLTIEVYEVDENTLLNSLDMLEGYPTFYNRTQIPTSFGDAWIYHFPESRWREKSENLVTSGDWKLFIGRR